MSRIVRVGVVVWWCGMAATVHAAPSLQHALARAQQPAAGSFAITYDFQLAVDALDHTDHQRYTVTNIHRDAESYILAEASPSVKVSLTDRTLCVQQQVAWVCQSLSAAQFAGSLKTRQMSLYPPTAMYLLEQLLARFPHAMHTTALGARQVAGRACAAFRLSLDAHAIGREALNQSLYVHIDADWLMPYVVATTLDLCFDQHTGQVLHYQTFVGLDQRQMQHDGLVAEAIAGFAASHPIGTLVGGLYAQRVE